MAAPQVTGAAALVLSRNAIIQRPARVLAQPKISKVAVTIKLCTVAGIDVVNVPHRDKANYSRARRLDWGNAAPEKNPKSE